MQVENSNIQSQNIFEKLIIISDDIISCNRSGADYKLKENLVNVYAFIFEQCTSKPSKSQNMFNKYKQILTLHFVNYVKSANIQYDQYIFRETLKFWNAYIKFATIISKKCFSYLDRYFLPARQHGNLIDVAVTIFDKNVFGNQTKRQLYIRCFADSIRTMRKNMIITQNHLYDFVKQLFPINTDLYFQLKKTYIEETRSFYEQKFRQMKDLQPIYFYNSIVNLIYFEQTLSSVCLYWTTQQILKERVIMPIIFTKEMIEPYTPIFLDHQKGFFWALKSFKVPLLNLVTDIYSKFEGFERIKKFYYDFIVEQSRQLLHILELIHEGEKVIDHIIRFFNKHQTILTTGFKKHQQIQVTLSNALQFGIGKWDKLPQILFNFCEKVVAEGFFQNKSQIIKQIFEKIGNKDEFIHKCQIWIQSIILNQKISIKELHKFTTFFHQLCGSENTQKLSKIVSDYIEQNQEFKTNSEFGCKVLSHHLWERRFKDEVVVCLTLPQALESLWNNYATNFTSNNPKKRLQLLPLSSHLIVSFRFNKSQLNIKCNTLQASILFSLQESPKKQQELIAHLNTQKHLINSFVASAKFISLREDKLTIDWNSDESGTKDFTQQFQQKSKFIKAIEQDRNILLEAGIVRMIKRRKETSFEEIFDYLCHNIKLFRPQPHMVKTTVQKLIKRDFIEMNEQGLYLYKQ